MCSIALENVHINVYEYIYIDVYEYIYIDAFVVVMTL